MEEILSGDPSRVAGYVLGQQELPLTYDDVSTIFYPHQLNQRIVDSINLVNQNEQKNQSYIYFSSDMTKSINVENGLDLSKDSHLKLKEMVLQVQLKIIIYYRYYIFVFF
jgi:hypothetical protein